MRFFEVLLLLVNLPVLGWGLTGWKRPFWLRVLPILAAVFTAVHLILEKYRWQMVPAYLLTALVLGWTLIRWQTKTAEPASRLSAVLKTLPAALAWLIAFAPPYLLPVPKLPTPTGPYAIGTITYHLRDSSRPEIYSDDPDDKREIMVQIWYPATSGVSGEPVPYIREIEVAGPTIATRLGQPAFLLDHLNLAYTHAVENVPMAAGDDKFPILIFSHGLQGFRNQNTAMVEELVSYGYVVATIDHTYANALTVFPDGRVVFYDPNALFQNGVANPQDGNGLVGVWAEDIRFVVDQMVLWNGGGGVASASLFNGRLDLTAIGVFGHSTGGGTAVEFCDLDSRCKAGIGLDAWVEPVTETIVQNGQTKPFMFLNAPIWLGEENAARGQLLYRNNHTAAYLAFIAGTDHYNFSDLPLLSPLTPQLGLAGPIDNYYSSEILNQYALAFFDTYLKGQPAELLQNDPPYPEVTWQKRE